MASLAQGSCGCFGQLLFASTLVAIQGRFDGFVRNVLCVYGLALLLWTQTKMEPASLWDLCGVSNKLEQVVHATSHGVHRLLDLPQLIFEGGDLSHDLRYRIQFWR